MVGLEAEYLYYGTCSLAEQQAGMYHLGVVEHQHGTLGQQLRQVVEAVLRYIVTAQTQQLGVVALGQRVAGYALVGQRIVVVGYRYMLQFIKHACVV